MNKELNKLLEPIDALDETIIWKQDEVKTIFQEYHGFIERRLRRIRKRLRILEKQMEKNK